MVSTVQIIWANNTTDEENPIVFRNFMVAELFVYLIEFTLLLEITPTKGHGNASHGTTH